MSVASEERHRVQGGTTRSFLWGIRQALNDIFSPGNAHNGYPVNLADASLEVSVVGGDNVDLVTLDAVDDAVVGVYTFMVAIQTLPAFVSSDAERKTVLWTKFFQLSHDT